MDETVDYATPGRVVHYDPSPKLTPPPPATDDALRAAFMEAQSVIAQFLAKNSSLRADLSDARNERAQARAAAVAANHARVDSDSRRGAAEKENADLREDLRMATAALADAGRELGEKTVEVVDLTKQLTETERQLYWSEERRGEEVVTFEEELADLRARAAALGRDDGARIEANGFLAAAEDALRAATSFIERARRALTSTDPGARLDADDPRLRSLEARIRSRRGRALPRLGRARRGTLPDREWPDARRTARRLRRRPRARDRVRRHPARRDSAVGRRKRRRPREVG